MNSTNIFDLEQIFVYELIGDMWLFFFVGLILIWFLSIKGRMPSQIPLLLSVMWGAICYSMSTANFLIVWIIILLGVGFIAYNEFAKVLK